MKGKMCGSVPRQLPHIPSWHNRAGQDQNTYKKSVSGKCDLLNSKSRYRKGAMICKNRASEGAQTTPLKY